MDPRYRSTHVLLAALFCFSPFARPVAGDTFQNYKLSSGCFAVSGNERYHLFFQCRKDFSLATFDSTQQMDELATVLGDATYYYVAVSYNSGTFSWSNGVAVEDAMWADGSPPSASLFKQCAALYKASSTARLTSVSCFTSELYICSSTNPASGCAGSITVKPVRSDPETTTSVTTTSLADPETTTSLTTMSDPVTTAFTTSQPDPLTTPSETTTSPPDPAKSTSETTTLQSDPVTTTSEPTASQPDQVTTASETGTSQQDPVTTASEPTTSQPVPVMSDATTSQPQTPTSNTSTPSMTPETSTFGTSEKALVTSYLPAHGNATAKAPRPCECRCREVTKMSNLSESELAGKVDQIKSELTVETSQLSATVRKKTSAQDERTSAKATGSVGIVVLVFVFAVPVILDLNRVVIALKSWWFKAKAATQVENDTSSAKRSE